MASDTDTSPQVTNEATDAQELLSIIDRVLESTTEWNEHLSTRGEEEIQWSQLSAFKDSIDSEIERLKALRNDLSEKLVGAESSVVQYPKEEKPYKCIPVFRFVSWKQLRKVKKVDRLYYAIEAPTKQPTHDQLKTYYSRSEHLINSPQNDPELHDIPEGPDFPLEESLYHTLGQRELPDRIRINSVRLSMFIDFNLHDGSLRWSRGASFYILRPFKLLVYKRKELLLALKDLEQQRYTRKPASEDDYDKELEDNYVKDWLGVGAIDVGEMELLALTALIKDFRCLVKFMENYIDPALERSHSENVFFSDLWYVFPEGSLIFIKDRKIPQKVWRVIQRTGGRRSEATESGVREAVREDGQVQMRHEVIRPSSTAEALEAQLKAKPFIIDCFHLDYDGARYVPTFHRVVIENFEGTQPTSSLPAMPFHAAEKSELIERADLLNRGREFIKCTRPSHREYTGRHQVIRPDGSNLHDKGEDVPENATKYSEWIESEVMIDFERALQEMPSWRPGGHEAEPFIGDRPPYPIDDDTVWDKKMTERLLESERDKWNLWDKGLTSPSEDEDLLLLPDRVFAFVFRTRKWDKACLQLGYDKDGVERLKERSLRPEPWNDLQLPEGHKRLVQSLIESHSANWRSKSLQFDLIRAKGKGVIILLHGVPGVGKTSTAECAAEANKKPLLPITCGDLGTSPKEVESKLEEAFQLAQLWECVLLLDEADIFLAQRSENDIQRNALVSVFLRVLEYYEGILFFTTNRVGVFDEAFKSRIHMALYYPALTWKFTEKIWRTHLKKLLSSGLVEVDEEEIVEYAGALFDNQSARGSAIDPVWNGRQIRNGFQSAVALAAYKHPGGKIRLDRDHFERVSKVSNEFNDYVWDIRQQTDADKAERWGYRYDRYQPEHHGGVRTDFYGNSAPGSFGGSSQSTAAQFVQNLAGNSLPYGGFQQPAATNNMGQTQHQGNLMFNSLQTAPAQPQSQFPVSQGGFHQQSVQQPQQLHQLQQQLQQQQQAQMQNQFQPQHQTGREGFN